LLLIQLKPKHHRLDILTIFQCGARGVRGARGAVFRDTHILPATCRCAGPCCPSACTTDCRSASAWLSRPTVGRIGHVLADWLSVG